MQTVYPRKIPPETNNPIDNICVDICEYLSPFFKKLNFTANTLTTFSLITGLISIYLFAKKRYVSSSVLYFISYIFDCFDGYYARKYDMITDFGDKYDHFKDITIFIAFAWLLYTKYKKVKDWRAYLPFVLLIMLLIMNTQLGCQEIYYDHKLEKNESKCLNFSRSYCPCKTKAEAYRMMRVTRYFGVGTVILYTCFLIIYCGVIDKL